MTPYDVARSYHQALTTRDTQTAATSTTPAAELFTGRDGLIVNSILPLFESPPQDAHVTHQFRDEHFSHSPTRSIREHRLSRATTILHGPRGTSRGRAGWGTRRQLHPNATSVTR
ncbi:hypothetical protein [Kocuria sp. JC486]|uniref:hypothetical protein n=1 Tax=Kocuria sp. JC486 TaxID=1970736 RepID=UPI001ADD779F|nr:hypothetical protein [Kocuria sp. JC486]